MTLGHTLWLILCTGTICYVKPTAAHLLLPTTFLLLCALYRNDLLREADGRFGVRGEQSADGAAGPVVIHHAATYYLLLTTYCLLPAACCLLPATRATCGPRLTNYGLLHHTSLTYYLPPAAYCLPPTTYHLLPAAGCCRLLATYQPSK